MTRQLIVAVAIISAPVTSAQKPEAGLVEVSIPQPVTANGRPLAPGTYDIRLTPDRPTLPSGTPSSTQRWVEFLSSGAVVAREIAELAVPDPSAQPPSTGERTRAVAQVLKEGDFVRVSLWEGSERYLIYLPTGTAARQPGAGPAPTPVTPR